MATPSTGTTLTSIWTVEIAPGTEPTPHSLTAEDLFVVIEGSAVVWMQDLDSVANPGDVIVVPPDTLFELSNGSNEPLRLLCCLPVGGQARMADGSTFTPPWAL
ncbi:cupin domain-containing protein [Ilumatobacter sp.]|uniref:cupin domain-containing protein n=1 Tax=Ilumatobacter sp. TaxID=1967498 RepID=UPI003C495D4F